MGHWGLESCSSDSCWDALHLCRDIHTCTSEEIQMCIEDLESNIDEYKNYQTGYKEVYAGVVVWGLNHECMINIDTLKQASVFIMNLLNEKEYLDCFNGDRKQALIEELDSINKAITNNGQGEHKHVTGLMEKICGKMTS
ncbi:MAG: hypothetical protein KAS32_12115 [Candidatus Peribacteraceae bacterium]|nr:hypothetical protein [Candidatus Peribacteraceae bacterium]